MKSTLSIVALLLLLAPAPAKADVPNPAWPSRCPLKLGLLIDQSYSMSSRFVEVREAASNVIDALRDKKSEITIIGFGGVATTIDSAVDVSDDDDRRALKETVKRIDTGDSGEGTNWEAALTDIAPLDLDVAVVITDGQPNTAAGGDTTDPVAAAVVAADRLKADGTRLVGIGIDLPPEGAVNLAAITGPVPGQDYYADDTVTLLRRLYDIVANSCGVPIDALPRPEPATFPWREVLLGAGALLLLLGLVAFGLHRKRRAPVTVTPTRRKTRIETPTIEHGTVAERLRTQAAEEQTRRDQAARDQADAKQAHEQQPTPDQTQRDQVAEQPGHEAVRQEDTGRPQRRSMSIDFLNREPPTKKDNP
ncbi:hypothetical protein GCM10022243_61830 [Saccharothrix violaceirubra]|uniref:VWFA domain-containing protein n=1 Tax=Saccharothrix violaceirubra TaxID=413306 RepID=A0A7W7T7T9_9PSEU|nr:vWA domain-containing protein [Saccharothrix violaceirubra]MBB4968159.1 hypothetical protein [Saccharothrix violaceirubra]